MVEILQDMLCGVPLRGHKNASASTSLSLFNVRNTVESIVSIWEKQSSKNGTIIRSYYASNIPEEFSFDSLRVQHSLNNLVANAVKFTKNGTISIIISRIVKASGKSFLALSVKDSGCGIDSNIFSSLFYKRKPIAKKNAQQFGVIETGLYATKNLVADLGGHVLVRSKAGVGSIFSIMLPLFIDGKTYCIEPKMVKPPAAPNPYRNLSILVVDDYNLNQLTIKALLYETVNAVHYASNGYEALEVLHSCPVDIILMDIHMPAMDGIEATLRIRENTAEWSDVYIASLSADPDYQHIGICKKIGMDAALAKPITKRELLNLFDDYIRINTLAATA